jgi:ASC-1-like (ASCH) protein
MWVKKIFFDLILSGEKTLEVRVLYPHLKSIQKGDVINLNNQAMIRVKDVRKYSSFEEMLSYEEASRIVPGVSREEVLSVLKSIYPPHKEQLGVLVLEIEPVRRENIFLS